MTTMGEGSSPDPGSEIKSSIIDLRLGRGWEDIQSHVGKRALRGRE